MRSRLTPLVTLGYRFAHALYERFWRVVPLTTVGVKVIATDPGGRVALVRTRYQSFWSLPGGGVHHRETPEHAASRELREETGIRIDPDTLAFAGFLSNFSEGKSDYIAVYVAPISTGVTPSPGIEIADTGWFDPDALPEGASPATRRRIAGWREGRIMTGTW